MGFLQICSGVVLLQLSKSAKDVPDAAVFKGDLDQIREVVTVEEPESEPKADSIRGAASILRRISTARRTMETDEARRFFHDKQQDTLRPPNENEIIEWDGLRRRKTVIGDGPNMSRSTTPRSPSLRQQMPPLGMSRLPTPGDEDENRPGTKQSNRSYLSDIRSHTSSLRNTQWLPLREQDEKHANDESEGMIEKGQLEEIVGTGYHGAGNRHIGRERSDTPRSIHWADDEAAQNLSPGHHTAQRQFSFNTIFNRIKSSSDPSAKRPMSPPKGILRRSQIINDSTKTATEEEQLGLVQGDSRNSAQEESLGEKLQRWSSNESEDNDTRPLHNTRPHRTSVSSMSTAAFPDYEDHHHALYSSQAANVSNPYYIAPSRQTTASPEQMQSQESWQQPPTSSHTRTRSNSSSNPHNRAPPPAHSSFSSHRNPNPLPPVPDETVLGVRSLSSSPSDMGVVSISSTEARDEDRHSPTPAHPAYPGRRNSGWRRHISDASSDDGNLYQDHGRG